MASNRQKADISSSSSFRAFGRAPTVASPRGSRGVTTSATGGATARFGPMPGLPSNLRAPDPSNHLAQALSSLANSANDVSQYKRRLLAEEQNSNTKLAGYNINDKGQAALNDFYLKYEEDIAKGLVVSEGMTPAGDFTKSILTDEFFESDPNYRALTDSRKESFKALTFNAFGSQAMSKDYAWRTQSISRESKNFSEKGTQDILSRNLLLVDGRLTSNGGPSGISEIIDHTVFGSGYSDAQKPAFLLNFFQNLVAKNVVGFDIENPDMDVFDAIVSEFNDPDNVGNYLQPADVERTRNQVLVKQARLAALAPKSDTSRWDQLTRNISGNDVKSPFSTKINTELRVAVQAGVDAANSNKFTPTQNRRLVDQIELLEASTNVVTALKAFTQANFIDKEVHGFDITSRTTLLGQMSSMSRERGRVLDDPDVTLSDRERSILNKEVDILEAGQVENHPEAVNEYIFDKNADNFIDRHRDNPEMLTDYLSELMAFGVEFNPSNRDTAQVFLDIVAADKLLPAGQSPAFDEFETALIVESALNTLEDPSAKLRIMTGSDFDINGVEPLNGVNRTFVPSGIQAFTSQFLTSISEKEGSDLINRAVAATFQEMYRNDSVDKGGFKNMVDQAVDANADPKIDPDFKKILTTNVTDSLWRATLTKMGRTEIKLDGGRRFFLNSADNPGIDPIVMASVIDMSPGSAPSLYVTDVTHNTYQEFLALSETQIRGAPQVPAFISRGGRPISRVVNLGTEANLAKSQTSFIESIKESSKPEGSQALYNGLIEALELDRDAGRPGSALLRTYETWVAEMVTNTNTIVDSKGSVRLLTQSADGNVVQSEPFNVDALQTIQTDEQKAGTENLIQQKQGGALNWFSNLFNEDTAEDILDDFTGLQRGKQFGDRFGQRAGESPGTFMLRELDSRDWSKKSPLKPDLSGFGATAMWSLTSTLINSPDTGDSLVGGVIHKVQDGDFNYFQVKGPMADDWGQQAKRISKSNPLSGVDAGHAVSRSLSSFIEGLSAQQFDNDENLYTMGSYFNRVVQEKLTESASVRPRLKEFLDKHKGSGVQIEMNVGLMLRDRGVAAPNNHFEKYVDQRGVVNLVLQIKAFDKDGNRMPDLDIEEDMSDSRVMAHFNKQAQLTQQVR